MPDWTKNGFEANMGISMEKLKRKIFFWILAALFAIVAPMIVMNAWGYRFDFSRGVFVHSGTVTVKTNPQDASIMINGETQSKKLNHINNSFNVTGLMPKNYDISVGAPGFQAWNKKADIHSGIATEFWNVLLVRDSYERAAYEAQGTGKFYVSPKNKYIASAENSGTGTTIKIFGIDSKKSVNAFSFPNSVFAPEEKEENIEWAPEEEFLSIPMKMPASQEKIKGKTIQADAGPKFAYFIADPATGESFNLNHFLEKNDIQDVRWDPKRSGYLFFLSENSLFRANIKNRADFALIAQDVSSFELSDNDIYWTQMPNNLVYKSGLEGRSAKSQLTNSFPQDSSIPNDRLIVYDDSRIAFLDRNNDMFIYNKGEHETYFKKLGGSITGMQFSDDGKKLLYWTDNELFVYFTRDWQVQPIRNENDIQNVTRYSEKIANVQWFKDYEHIIFTANNQVKIIELDARDHRNCMDIVKLSEADPVAVYNNSLEKLFFIDKDSVSSNIYSINFPEPDNILGIFTPSQQ